MDIGQVPDLSKAITSDGVSAVDWILAGAVLAAGIIASFFIRRGVVSLMRRGTSSESFAEVLVGRLVRVAVVAFALVLASAVLGVQFGPLLGALGLGGIALVLALQPTMQNLFAGMVLHAQRPFRVGEEVKTGDATGTVIDITSRSVLIRRNSGEMVYIPNSMVLDGEIENLVRFGRRRSTVVVSVAYGTDLARAREVITAAATTCDGVLKSPPPRVLVRELADSGVNIDVDFWHQPKEAERRRVRGRVIQAVYAALNEAGINIPFPQRTLWMGDSGDSAEVESSET